MLKIKLILSMIIFGSIGLFVRYIPLSSSIIALIRGIVGTMFLLGFVRITKKKISKDDIWSNWNILLLSGSAIGLNWILLFESYRYTTISIATLCYYMAPIIVIILSPLFLKEKLTSIKIIGIIIAMLGMILVSGVLDKGTESNVSIKGIFFGIAAASLYASVIIMNKKIRNISIYDRTIMQLGTASIFLLPYTILTNDLASITKQLMLEDLLLLIIVGIIHTGIAYAFYFSSMEGLKAQTVAVYSYIDPIISIFLSGIILKESMGILSFIGAMLILGSTFFMELYEIK